MAWLERPEDEIGHWQGFMIVIMWLAGIGMLLNGAYSHAHYGERTGVQELEDQFLELRETIVQVGGALLIALAIVVGTLLRIARHASALRSKIDPPPEALKPEIVPPEPPRPIRSIRDAVEQAKALEVSPGRNPLPPPRR